MDDLSPSHQDTLHILGTIAAATVRMTAAHYFLHHDDKPIDLEDPALVAGLPYDEVQDLLQHLRDAYNGDAADDRESTSGAPQIPADRFANELVHQQVDLLLGDVIAAVAGEESSGKQWEQIPEVPVGKLLLIIDPIDGSTLLQTTGANFSVNFVLYRRTRRGYKPVGMVAADASAKIIIADLRTGKVSQIAHGDTRLFTEPDYVPATIRPWSLAVVAVSGPARERVAPLFDTTIDWGLPPKIESGGRIIDAPALDVITCGGAPLLLHYLTGGLGYIVIPTFQTVYDAAPLIALALVGGSRFTRTDTKEVLTSQQVIRLFDTLNRPGEEPGTIGAKPIPPMLVSRTIASTEVDRRIVDALHAAWTTPMKLVAVPKVLGPDLRVVKDKEA